MLLLVVQAEREQGFDDAPERFIGGVQQGFHAPIHVRAVGQHFIQRGPGQQAAMGSRMARAERLVVGIEQVLEARIERLVATGVRRQQDGLEKPARVRQMPLGRTRFGHRLNALVFRAQRRDARHGFRANHAVVLAHRAGRMRKRAGKRHVRSIGGQTRFVADRGAATP